jgi:hypothetical protein
LNSQGLVKAGLVEVSVSGTFKTEHEFNTPEGGLGSLTIKGSKGEGTFNSADDSVLEIKKPSIWKSQYELEEEQNTIGKAYPPKKLKQAFEIDFEGEFFKLDSDGSKSDSWTLSDHQGSRICEVLPRGGFKRGAQINVGVEIPLKLLVFVYYLVNKRWSEDAAPDMDF